MKPVPILALVLAATTYTVKAPAETLGDRVYRDRRIGFELTAPDGWRLSTQTGFPSLLLILLPTTGDGMVSLSLAATELKKRDLARYVAESKRALQKAGLRVTAAKPGKLMERPVWNVTVKTTDERRLIHQVYFKFGKHALTWTLTCPKSAMGQLLPEIQRAMLALQPLSD